jgi:hypothetical protein
MTYVYRFCYRARNPSDLYRRTTPLRVRLVGLVRNLSPPRHPPYHAILLAFGIVLL